MYIIRKTIFERWHYYWNGEKNRWEGLRSNAEKFPQAWMCVDKIKELQLKDTDATYGYEQV